MKKLILAFLMLCATMQESLPLEEGALIIIGIALMSDEIHGNFIKIENRSNIALKLTVSYKSCGKPDVEYMNPGQDAVVRIRGCQIYAIKLDAIILPNADGMQKDATKDSSWAKSVPDGETLNKATFFKVGEKKEHFHKKTFEFKGPDANGHYTFIRRT